MKREIYDSVVFRKGKNKLYENEDTVMEKN